MELIGIGFGDVKIEVFIEGNDVVGINNVIVIYLYWINCVEGRYYYFVVVF